MGQPNGGHRNMRREGWVGGCLRRAQRSFAATAAAALTAVISITVPSPARAAGETVEIFSAGSLRGVVADLTQEAQSAFKVEIKATFGGSGSLRERIERGETPDLFLSADLGHPLALESQGRTVVPAIVFARNRMCVISRKSAGVTARNLIDRLLAKDVRVKTSTPIADPAGDYAWAIFDRIDTLRPGAGAKLKEKAQTVMHVSATPAPGQSATAALFVAKQVDMSITYCSGWTALQKEVPDLTSLEVPPQLDPHPVDGIAVLSHRPQAMQVALFLLSQKGQAILAKEGLVPLLDSGNRP
jgi:ABC-type molybdate transport system substrate-binding protein